MKSPRKFYLSVSAICAALSLAGCSTVMPVEKSGFLSSYDHLSQASPGGTGDMHAQVSLDPAKTTVTAIEWRVDEKTGISTEEQAELIAQFRADLQDQIAHLPVVSGGRPAHVRAVITKVVTVSPGLNVLSMALAAAPWDRGGAAVEIEADDAETNQQLAALTLGYYAPLTNITARFKRLAPAKIAIQRASTQFAELLKP
jgi:hypothetical protein